MAACWEETTWFVDKLGVMSLDATSMSQVMGEVTTNFDCVGLKTKNMF